MKRTWIIMALLVSFGFASAQEADTTKVERQINIEKEYTPEIKEVKRKDIEYKVEETSVKPSNLTYSNYALPINPQTPFSPLAAEKQSVVRLKGAKTGYADLGVGFDMNWKAEGYYKILDTEYNFLDVHLDHVGTYWGEKDPKAYIRTGVNFDFTHKTDVGHEIDANVMYRNQYYSYYGEDVLDWDYLKDYGLQQFQCRHTLNMSAAAHSTKSMNDWDYKADIGYRMDDLQYDNVAELRIFGGATGYKSFGKHQIELKVAADGYIYSSVGNTMKCNNNVYVEVSPYYNLNMPVVDLRIGARMLMSCMRWNVFNAMPDVTATIHPHKMVRLTLAAVGDYRCNVLSQMMDMNQYYYYAYSDTLKDTYTPVDFKLGLTLTPVNDLSLSARAQYAFVENEVNFYNTTRYFNAEYINTQHLVVGIDARYVYKERYTFFADFAWNKWFTKDNQTVWYKPEYELHAGVEFIPIDDLRLDINYYFAAGRQCYDVVNAVSAKMTDIHDLNIGASYLIKKLVTVYVRANNILGSTDGLRWQMWNGYDNIGFNMIFGAKISF